MTLVIINISQQLEDVHVFKQDNNCNSTDIPLVKQNCDGDKSKFFNKNYVILLVIIFTNTLEIIQVIEIGRSFYFIEGSPVKKKYSNKTIFPHKRTFTRINLLNNININFLNIKYCILSVAIIHELESLLNIFLRFYLVNITLLIVSFIFSV